ncbi:MAG TPA: dienelactone hydrolase family protein [Candidatus Dormibacteraeota bacterium]
MVEFPSNGSSCSGYLAVPASGSGPGVVVIQEWWGLVPHIKTVCDRLADDGFVALAVDLYHGATTTEPDEAGKLAMGMRIDQAGRDMGGAVSHLVQHDAVSGDAVGSVGFCMGGGLSLYLATLAPAVKACTMYYGVIPWPDCKPQFQNIRGKVLGHFAENDGSASHAKVDPLERQLKGAGVPTEFHWYAGTQHAFFNDARPEVYNAEAAQLSYRRTLDFFRAELR